jgi:hypothetical protein
MSIATRNGVAAARRGSFASPLATARNPDGNLPFWICLLFWGLLPATWTPWFEIGCVRCCAKDLVLLALSGYYALVCVPRWSNAVHECRRLPLCFFLLNGYGLLSMTWGDLSADNAWNMGYTLLMSSAACHLACRLVVGRTPENVERFLSQCVLVLAGLSAVYFAESYFDLGLRSEAGLAFDYAFNDFGIERLRGPLYGAAHGHIVLLPALGFAVDRVTMRTDRAKLLWGGVSFVLALSILALGSRAALVCLLAFVFLAVLGARRLGRSLAIGAVFLATLVGGSLFLFQRATGERLTDLQDTAREDTYRSAWERIQRAGWRTAIVGAGYGAVWPWYEIDVSPFTTGLLVETEDGLALYHPHSLPLLLIVELGIPGVAFFLLLLGVLGQDLLRARRRDTWSALAAGNAASVLGLAATEILLKYWPFSVLWWVSVLACSLLVHRNALPQQRSPRWKWS